MRCSILLALAALACGHTVAPAMPDAGASSCEVRLPQGSFATTGTIDGAPISAEDVFSGSSGAPNLDSTEIIVTPRPCLCDRASTSLATIQEAMLWIEVSQSCGPDAGFCFHRPSAPGTFQISGQTRIASSRFDACDGGSMVSIPATVGQVVVTGVDDAGIRGTFDLTYASGDHLTGSFDAPTCQGMGYHNGAAVVCH